MLEIIAETPHYIVVNKIAGVNVERWDGFLSMEKLVYDYLHAQNQKKEHFVGVVHRLDRAVSGVLLMAKKKSALKILNQQFEERKVTKKYLALVENQPTKSTTTLNHFLQNDKKNKKAIIFDQPTKEALPCSLSYTMKDIVNGDFLLEVALHTGRFHQIRAQLAHIGSPIIGDSKYGAKKTFLEDSIALHAFELSFFDPVSHQKVTYTKPPTWAKQ